MPAVAVAPAHRRHDISDRVWEILEPLLPGGKGKTGRPAQDNRRFINAVFWNAPAPPGGICPRTTGTGRTPTAASATGGTGTSGPGCWRR